MGRDIRRIGSAVLSQWLTVFGKNLWWSLWAFYLPMIVVFYLLKRHRVPSNRQFIKFGILIFTAVLIKCFINGFEYITTTLVMMVTPCIYYVILDKWSRHSMPEVDACSRMRIGRSNFFESHALMFPDRCGEGRIHGRRWACGLFLRKANARRGTRFS